MALGRSRLFRETLNAAMRFASHRPWEKHGADIGFAIRAPDEDVFTLVLEGDPLAPQVSSEFVQYEEPASANVVVLPATPPGMDALRRLTSRWLVAFPVVPVVIEEDDRMPRALIIFDEESGNLLEAMPIAGATRRQPCNVFLRSSRATTLRNLRGFRGRSSSAAGSSSMPSPQRSSPSA